MGIILSTGGLGDKNFNDMTYAGAQQAEKDFGIEFDYVETQSASDFLPNYRMFAESGEYDLIIGLAADQTEAINEISIDLPEQKISHIDSSTDCQRQRRLYQVAGADLPDRRGGRPGHPVRHGQGQQRKRGGRHPGPGSATLRMGVVALRPACATSTPTARCWSRRGRLQRPRQAKEIALSMYNRGADFVQHIAGASGMGVFTAAKEADRYAFGVGGNQNYIEPDYIVATALRDVNTIVYNEIKAW